MPGKTTRAGRERERPLPVSSSLAVYSKFPAVAMSRQGDWDTMTTVVSETRSARYRHFTPQGPMSSKQYTFHIGLPKTGTTTLQTCYFGSATCGSLAYNPPEMLWALTEAIKLHDFDMLTDADLRLLRQVIRRYEDDIPHERIFISHEILSHRLGRFCLGDRGRVLKVLFPEATVVLVLRNQPDILRSLYEQFVRQHFVIAPEEMFLPFACPTGEPLKDCLLIDVRQWDYAAACKSLRGLFEGRLHVFFYESFPDLFALGEVILGLVGCRINSPPQLTTPKLNRSYGAVAVRLTLALARFGLAFRASRGANSRRVEDLAEQAMRSRLVFDAPSVDAFLALAERTDTVSRELDSRADALFRKLIRLAGKLGAHQPYRFPRPLREHLTSEAGLLNEGLHEVLADTPIPEEYGDRRTR